MSQEQLRCQTEPQTITVGDVVKIICEGSADADALQVSSVAEVAPYTIVPLKNIRQPEGQLELQVTSYRVGDHQLNLQIKDKDVVLAQLPMQLSVKTVIEKPQETKEPIGPLPPLSIAYPLWFWIMLAVIVVILITVPVALIIRRARKKKRWQELRQKYPHEPEQEFFKLARQMHRDLRTENFQDFREKLHTGFNVFFSIALEEAIAKTANGEFMKKVEKTFFKKNPDLQKEFRILMHEVQDKTTVMDLNTSQKLLIRAQKFMDQVTKILRRPV